MESKLTINQRNYILYHLAFSVDISPKINSQFVFGSQQNGKICFLENNKIFDEKHVVTINSCPVLFPGDPGAPFYTYKEGTLIFHHDLLKSAFYLLSGYQEYISDEKDLLGRFPYESSVQHKLNIITRPLVNEYFEQIHEGISLYCRENGIEYNKPEIFKSPVFFLTHDVDRIDKYTFHTIKGKIKRGHFKEAVLWFFRWINPFYKKNPYWTYDFLESAETKRKLNSVYFFLNRGVKHIDSYYSFQDERIKSIINHLEKSGFGIGLHSGVKTQLDYHIMKKNLKELNDITLNAVEGNRQHRLLFKIPETMRNLSKCSVKYDSSLGFAAHEGFRNSYCYPFKLYDFEKDEIINVWEIPLVVMDVTLFTYRKLDISSAMENINLLVREIIKHNGVFTLLVHPETLDEEEHPGIFRFYEDLLDLLLSKNINQIKLSQLLNKLNQFEIFR